MRPAGDEEVGTLVVDEEKTPAKDDVSGLESPAVELDAGVPKVVQSDENRHWRLDKLELAIRKGHSMRPRKLTVSVGGVVAQNGVLVEGVRVWGLEEREETCPKCTLDTTMNLVE